MQGVVSNMPLVSVVIASYNMGQYIAQAVDSILSQTWSNLEVIVIDDGSQDNTPAVMQSYVSDKRIRYFRTDNQGQPKAKNYGLKLATGDFIAFCDADDFWESNKLEVQMPLFENLNVGIVYSEISNIDENNKRYMKPPVYKRYTGSVTDQLLIRNFVPFGTSVIRRQCILQNGIFDEQFRMGIDWDLWLRYSLDWEFAYTPERTYVYREWAGQMSNNYRGRYDFAFQILNSFVNKHGHRLNKSQLKKAWADMYIGKGNTYAKNEKTFREPFRYIVKGLSMDPANVGGWKSLVKVIIRWY